MNSNKEGALRILSASTLDNNTQAIVLALLYIGDQIAQQNVLKSVGGD